MVYTGGISCSLELGENLGIGEIQASLECYCLVSTLESAERRVVAIGLAVQCCTDVKQNADSWRAVSLNQPSCTLHIQMLSPAFMAGLSCQQALVEGVETEVQPA